MPISSTTTVSPNMITVPLNKSLNSAIVATKFEKDTKKTENGTKNANGNEPKMEIGKESVKNANKSEKGKFLMKILRVKETKYKNAD